jgi:hypothetical protein
MKEWYGCLIQRFQGDGGIDPLEKITQFKLYELGRALAPLTDFADSFTAMEVMIRVHGAIVVVTEFLSPTPPVRLGLSMPALREVKREIDEIQEGPAADAFGLGLAQQPAREIQIPGSHLTRVRAAIRKFETILDVECQANAAFIAPQRQEFNTDVLVNAGRRMIPDALKPAVSDKALLDLDEAGRCFAFGLFTASGFHACRAVEAVMEDYYRRMCNSTKTLKSWYDYIKALEAASAVGGNPCPEPSTVAHLETMKKYNRNEIAHPRVVLNETEAAIVLALAKVVICQMAQELLDAGAASLPSAAPGSSGAIP